MFSSVLQGKSWNRMNHVRWEDEIKVDIREIGWVGVEGVHLSEDSD
jgi:hypothetical protein